MVENAQELLDDDELLEPTPEEKLAEYFEGLGAGSGIRIGIHEVDPENRSRRGFLFYLDYESLSSDELLSQILAKYGPGEYEAMAKDQAGHFKFRQRFTLGSIKKAAPAIPDPAGTRGASSAHTGTDPDVLRLIEGQNRMIEALVANTAQGAPPAPAKSLLEQLAELGPALGALKDFIQPSGGSNDVLKTVRDVLKLRDEFGEEGGPSDPLSVAVKSLMPVITKAVDRMDSADRTNRARAFRTATELAGAPGAAPAEPGTEPVMSTIPTTAPDVAILSMYLGPVLSWAEAKTPAVDAARQVGAMINGLPDDGFIAVLTFLEGERPVARLAEIDSRVNDHQDWFGELVREVLALFPPDPPESLAEPGTVVVDSEAATQEGDKGDPTGPGSDTS